MSAAARLVWGAVALGAAAFALQGGEYATTDLMRQRARERALTASVDTLQRAVDSLRVLERRLRTDPVLQETVAREEFGMVRGDRELLYRFAEPADTSGAGGRPAAPAGASTPAKDSAGAGVDARR